MDVLSSTPGNALCAVPAARMYREFVRMDSRSDLESLSGMVLSSPRRGGGVAAWGDNPRACDTESSFAEPRRGDRGVAPPGLGRFRSWATPGVATLGCHSPAPPGRRGLGGSPLRRKPS